MPDSLAAELAAIRERYKSSFITLPAPGEARDAWTHVHSADDVPRLLAAVEAALDLHRPFGIYDECEHDHTEDDAIAETAIDAGLFLTCADALMYRVCTECCTEGTGQTEECAGGHKHGPAEPYCRTYAAISSALLGEDGTDGPHR